MTTEERIRQLEIGLDKWRTLARRATGRKVVLEHALLDRTAERDELVEALRECQEWIEIATMGGEHGLPDCARRARKVLGVEKEGTE